MIATAICLALVCVAQSALLGFLGLRVLRHIRDLENMSMIENRERMVYLEAAEKKIQQQLQEAKKSRQRTIQKEESNIMPAESLGNRRTRW